MEGDRINMEYEINEIEKMKIEIDRKFNILTDAIDKIERIGENCEIKKEKQMETLEQRFNFILNEINKLEKRVEENEVRDDELFKRILNIEDKIIELKLRWMKNENNL